MNVKHTILTLFRFEDRKLLNKYLKMMQKVLIPCLKSQGNKNFTWIILTHTPDVEYLRTKIDYPFLPLPNIEEYIKYVFDNNINIQTRHDSDDFMSSEYIEAIQKTHRDNIGKLDAFLVQSQPVKYMYHSKVTHKMSPYHSERCSMHLSLCQKKVKHHIYEKKHGDMYKVCSNIITLHGYTKWVIHGDNLSLRRK